VERRNGYVLLTVVSGVLIRMEKFEAACRRNLNIVFFKEIDDTASGPEGTSSVTTGEGQLQILMRGHHTYHVAS
jgi:hypothetical protein